MTENSEINFKNQIITCPHCGKEYLAAEIFYPGAVYGKPVNTIRDAVGKILYTEWQENWEPNSREKFICDQCDNQFVVDATVSFKANKEAEELDFKNQYSSLF